MRLVDLWANTRMIVEEGLGGSCTHELHVGAFKFQCNVKKLRVQSIVSLPNSVSLAISWMS